MWCEFGRRREDEVIFGACCGPWRAIACGWGGGGTGLSEGGEVEGAPILG